MTVEGRQTKSNCLTRKLLSRNRTYQISIIDLEKILIKVSKNSSPYIEFNDFTYPFLGYAKVKNLISKKYKEPAEWMSVADIVWN